MAYVDALPSRVENLREFLHGFRTGRKEGSHAVGLNLSTAYCPLLKRFSMLYHTTIILVFRPLTSHARSKFLPEPFGPLGSCTSSAVKISTLAKAYHARYSLRNIVNIAVHAVFTASTSYLSNLASKHVSYEPNAHQYLESCMSFLEEMGET